MMKKLLIGGVFAVLMLVCGRAAFAQSTSGGLTGVVKDASGAVVANATITATDEKTNVTTTATTNGSGEFRIPNLLPSVYDVKVVAAGFQPYIIKAVSVDLSKLSNINVPLSVGSTSTVEVTADSGTTLDTTTTNLTTTFTAQELSVLPAATFGLGVLNTSLLVPGVSSSGGIGIGTGPAIAGQRPRNNNYTIEGIDNNSKGVTGPLVYVPTEGVADFTLITTQFSPQYGHSNGGQFNTNVKSGTNSVHGTVYENFDNRNLNAEAGVQGGKPPINPRYDFNRYGGGLGAPIFKNKLFVFGNYERQTTGQSETYYVCTPTAAGLATLGTLPYGFNATNLAQYLKYTPTANANGGAQVTGGGTDNACFETSSGLQSATVYQGTTLTSGEYGSGASTAIPLGNYLVSAPVFTNFKSLTTSSDYTISSKDNLRLRYLYNATASQDTAANLPVFFQSEPYKYHLIALSEFHNFTPNLTNEFRIGFNRYATADPAGNFSYPGLDLFPNLTFVELGDINYGPDSNAPQSTVQNLYQLTNNLSWTKGTHTFTIGFDGRKYIAPQTFTQRVRGDYEWTYLTEFLHDLAPTYFGQRSTGNFIYYGDQTALYGYGNDTWRITPSVTLNFGLRYEFTSVPVGERAQSLNAAASAPGVLTIGTPQPAYKNFAPRFGVNWSPDAKTSVRLGFGMGYDVIFDNLGLLSFPPQYSSTNSVNDANTNYTGNTNPNSGDPNFLGGYSNVAGAPVIHGLPPGNGGLATYSTIAKQRAATAAFVPNQVTPYAESYNLQIQRTISSSMLVSIGYVGTHGIHLETQDQINKQPKVTAANQLPTNLAANATGTISVGTTNNVNTLALISANSAVVAPFLAAGFTSSITSYQPYSHSNYNALTANLTRRMSNGLQANVSYTFSKTMDDATAEVNSTGLTPRRPQNSQCVACDYSRSALDHTHRITVEAIYDLPYFKHSNMFVRNTAGNWLIAPVYSYESPEYATVLSNVNSNLNGDSAAIDRTIINPNGAKGTVSKVYGVYSANPAVYGLCAAGSPVTATGGTPACTASLIGYQTANANGYYVQAGAGTLPNGARNTLPIRPIDNLDLTAVKRFTFRERYGFEVSANSLNVLNHAQYLPGSPSTINTRSTAGVTTFNAITSGTFNQPGKTYSNNARSLQLGAHLTF